MATQTVNYPNDRDEIPVEKKKRGRPRGAAAKPPEATEPSASEAMVPAGAPAPVQRLSEKVERVLIGGDLAGLSPDERMSYYQKLCETLGLNPYSQPFEYLVLNGRLQLYAKKNCTDQLRRIHGVSVDKATPSHDLEFGIYTVVVEGHDRDGRRDTGLGVVNVAGMKGDMLANAMMKCETKSKRRFTLSLCGLGMLDESELETIPSHQYALGSQPQLEAPVEQQNGGNGGQVVWSASDHEMIKGIAQSIRSCNTFGDLVETNAKCYKGAEQAQDPTRVRAELAKFVQEAKKKFPQEVAQFATAKEARRGQRAN